MRTPDPFAAEAPVDRIETSAEETAAQQYLKALQINTLDAWQAVVTNFPNDPEYSDKARVQVLINLIRVNRLVEAEKLINEFSIRQSDTYALAVADAGKAILANLDNRYEESHLLISQINRAKLPEAMTLFLVQFEEKNDEMLAKSSPSP